MSQEPEIVQRIRRYAGKTRRDVSNPSITAAECIELADWLESVLPRDEKSHEQKFFDGLVKAYGGENGSA